MTRLRIVLFGLLVAGAAWADSSQEPPRRQIVDLRSLEIEGSVPHPSTLFIRERSTGSLHELFPFHRRLPRGWLLPIVKESFDVQTIDLVDRKKR